MDRTGVLSQRLAHEKGYEVIKPSDLSAIQSLRSKLVELAKSSSIDDLRHELTKLSNAEINEIMISLLQFTHASGLLANAFRDTIRSLCGNEIFLQRRANIIMNLPGDKQRHQWPHYEFMSGISPYTYTIWLPLHDLLDQSGIFYLTDYESLAHLKKEMDLGVANGPQMFEAVGNPKATKLCFGDAVIFNPFVIHGNTPFESGNARLAISFRFQSATAPLYQKNSDFLKTWTLEGD